MSIRVEARPTPQQQLDAIFDGLMPPDIPANGIGLAERDGVRLAVGPGTKIVQVALDDPDLTRQSATLRWNDSEQGAFVTVGERSAQADFRPEVANFITYKALEAFAAPGNPWD